ncbi:GNAT family N-acetyltransferase [Flavobacterium sp. RHBU_24]|uniref:GNAT family N-acetyltransferase n=1 Tax=Flavobacterium sp. RHBU_24 TaxID=3391185 RepID=UPI003984966F
MKTWKTDGITNILPEEFYALVARNREHIAKTFPVTLAGCTDFESTVAFLLQGAENVENGTYYYFYPRDISSGKLIGYLVVKNIDRHVSKCELGYFIDKDFQGLGITSKLVANALIFCFETLLMNKVYICTSTTNTASQKVALKNGFVQEGILKEEFKNGDGLLEDIVYFGLLKSDYII